LYATDLIFLELSAWRPRLLPTKAGSKRPGLIAKVPFPYTVQYPLIIIIAFLDRHITLIKQMSSDGRSRRREMVEEAYKLQVKAGLMARRIPF
jgi:hypothetical protein